MGIPDSGREVWQAGIGSSTEGPAVTEEQARKALPKGWELGEAEDAEQGVWLVAASSRIQKRLEAGHEYRWKNPATGWEIEINQP